MPKSASKPLKPIKSMMTPKVTFIATQTMIKDFFFFGANEDGSRALRGPNDFPRCV